MTTTTTPSTTRPPVSARPVDCPFSATRTGDRHTAYRALAADGPVTRISTPDGEHAWLISDYNYVRQLLTDGRLVKADSPTTAITEQLVPELAPALTSHMLRLDGPEHIRLRTLVSAGFTRSRIEGLRSRIEHIADQLLDQIHTIPVGEATDLIAAYALPLPMTVICELIGVPEPDRADFRTRTTVLAGGYFADRDEFAAAATEQTHYVRALVEHKRRHPSDDLLSALVVVRENGDRLSEDELTSMVWILVAAGHETTVNLITNAVHALLTHPAQLTLLRTDPTLIETAVEEFLRLDGPLQTAIPLRATTSLRIANQYIPAGDTVLAGLLAANHDPARFTDPDTLDIARADNAHIAFGHGPHYCLGAPLARLEARIAIARLLARFPNLHLAVPADQLRWRPNFLLHNLTTLPIHPG
jgi:cytochrome P450